MEKDRIDKLTWLILNNVISLFGLKMRKDELIYIYRIPQDGCKNIYKINRLLKGGSWHIVHITDDLNKIFEFVGLDRNEYEDGFKTMFDYNSWIIRNCLYLSRLVINSLEHGLETDSIKTDEQLHEDLKRFLTYTRLSHEEIKDNSIFPAMLYYNIKEEIIRNFFWDEELEEKFRKLKKAHLFKNELANKFNTKKIVHWIPKLKGNQVLIDLFGRNFIKYATKGKIESFPDYLVDSEEAEIRREAINFYEYDFVESEKYESSKLDTYIL